MEYRSFVVPAAHPVRRQLQAAWDLYRVMGDEVRGDLSSTERITHILFSEFVRCARIFRSVLALVADGFGPEAEAMTRTMYESNVVCYWAMQHPAEAARRFDLHVGYVAYLSGVADSESGEGANGIDLQPAVLDEAKALFGKYGERAWHGCRLVDLDEDLMAMLTNLYPSTGMVGYFEGLHRWLNWNAHGSPWNLFRPTLYDETRRIFVVAPSDLDLADALDNATDQVLLAVMLHYMASDQAFPRAIEKQAFEVWVSKVPGASLAGRNDPCPCGSGKKYKTCHLFR